jgi:pyruvate kinase
MKRTKIVATIGPSSSSKEILRKMIEAGMNVARINFSHGDHNSNGELIKNIKESRKELNLPVGIMADLEGPRVRILVENEIEVNSGDKVVVYDLSLPSNFQFPISNIQKNSNGQIPNEQKTIKFDKEEIIKCVEVGNEILIEDGKIKLKVIEKNKDYLLAEVIVAGTIKNHKGVNIPDAKLSFGALTEKDVDDLKFALSQDVDFVALSFVGNAQDILEAKDKIKEITGKNEDLPLIVSKIERKEAIKNIDEIIDATDAVMVARGDLGIEMPEMKVVIFQKEIIGKCLAKNKPVIVATQMLESMITNPLPTRAEVADVTNAVIDHTDAVMLSGESANGKYPVEAIATMSEIINETEKSSYDDYVPAYIEINKNADSNSISTAYKLSKTSGAKAIIMLSETGRTARQISNYRPEKLMLMATANAKTFQQVSVIWGISGYLLNKKEADTFANFILKKAKQEKILQKGDKAVIIPDRLANGEKMRVIGIQEVA